VSARSLAVVAAAVLATMLLLRGADMGPPPPVPSPRARTPRAPRAASAAAAVSTRDVFEFAPRPVAEAPRRPPAHVPRESPEALAPPVVPAVRFVGLVRRGGVLRAALQVHGEPVVLGKGETAGGYRVVAIDEDGVRLQAPDGSTLTLAAGGS
jgi:hypothetical protein